MPKPITVVLSKNYTVDLEEESMKRILNEKLNEMGIGSPATASDIEAAIKELLNADVDTNDVDSTNFDVVVPAGTEVEVIEDELDEG